MSQEIRFTWSFLLPVCLSVSQYQFSSCKKHLGVGVLEVTKCYRVGVEVSLCCEFSGGKNDGLGSFIEAARAPAYSAGTKPHALLQRPVRTVTDLAWKARCQRQPSKPSVRMCCNKWHFFTIMHRDNPSWNCLPANLLLAQPFNTEQQMWPCSCSSFSEIERWS